MASREAPHVLQLARGPLPGTCCISQNVTHTAAWPCSPPFQRDLTPLCPFARSGCCRQHMQCSWHPSVCQRGPGPRAEQGSPTQAITLTVLGLAAQLHLPKERCDTLAAPWGCLAARPLPPGSYLATGREPRPKVLSPSLHCIHPLPLKVPCPCTTQLFAGHMLFPCWHQSQRAGTACMSPDMPLQQTQLPSSILVFLM